MIRAFNAMSKPFCRQLLPFDFRYHFLSFGHMPMYITDEVADLREKILKQAILDQGLSESIALRWLRVD